MKEENITNEELLAAVKAGFAKMATKEDLDEVKEDISGMRMDIDQLKKGAFTEIEKESVVGMAEQANQQLEDDTKGNKNITLTRSEYDGVASTVGFENRFEKVGQ